MTKSAGALGVRRSPGWGSGLPARPTPTYLDDRSPGRGAAPDKRRARGSTSSPGRVVCGGSNPVARCSPPRTGLGSAGEGLEAVHVNARSGVAWDPRTRAWTRGRVAGRVSTKRTTCSSDERGTGLFVFRGPPRSPASPVRALRILGASYSGALGGRRDECVRPEGLPPRARVDGSGYGAASAWWWCARWPSRCRTVGTAAVWSWRGEGSHWSRRRCTGVGSGSLG